MARSIYEGTLTAHWARDHAKEAVDLYEKHSRYTRVMWADKVREANWRPGEDLPDATPEEREELSRLFGRWGERHWTTRNLHALRRTVERQWSDGSEELRSFHKLAHYENNLIQHSSAWSLERTLQSKDPETLTLEAGPATQYVEKGLFSLLWSYGQTLSLVMDVFDMPDRARFTELLSEAVDVFLPLPAGPEE